MLCHGATCVSVYHMRDGGQWPEEALEPLKLELQVILSYYLDTQNPGPLEESVLVTAEPFLQPLGFLRWSHYVTHTGLKPDPDSASSVIE